MSNMTGGPFDPHKTGPGWTFSNDPSKPVPQFSFKPTYLPVTFTTQNGFAYTFDSDYYLDDASSMILAGILGATGLKRVPFGSEAFSFSPSFQNFLVFPKGQIDAGMVAYHFVLESDPVVALQKANAEVASLR